MTGLRLVALNVDHQTRPGRRVAVHEPLAAALLALKPDVVILTEFVLGAGRRELVDGLRAGGLPYQLCSPERPHNSGTFKNQVFVASRLPVQKLSDPPNPPDDGALTNQIVVEVAGIVVNGGRIPESGKRGAGQIAQIREWFAETRDGDVVVGDFNFHPGRSRSSKDTHLPQLMSARGWRRHADVEGEWSYRGKRRKDGSRAQSAIDHVFTRGGRVVVASARYVQEAFVLGELTDHAALVVELLLR